MVLGRILKSNMRCHACMSTLLKERKQYSLAVFLQSMDLEGCRRERVTTQWTLSFRLLHLTLINALLLKRAMSLLK